VRAKKVASPDYKKRFSVLILKIYHRESKRITFSQRFTLEENQKQNQEESRVGAVPNRAL
jgi:hypothetical protein